MSMSHNQMAYVAIVSTLIFGSLFVGASGFFQTSEGAGDFDPAAEDDLIGEGSNTGQSLDSDDDGLVNAVESQYGTDPFNNDTDGDGMEDGWEVENGLNPLDNGESDDAENDPSEANSEGAEEQEEEDSWPDPDDGPKGDPDRDGLINSVEVEEGTNPRLADTDGDGLNDKWEVTYKRVVNHPAGNYTLFDPLSGNWNCVELTDAMEESLEDHFNGENGVEDWDDLSNAAGEHSCDQVLDSDNDGLFNLEEEEYGTDPTKADSDGDMLDDIHEISNSTIMIMMATGQNCGLDLLDPVNRQAPFAADALEHGLAWFKEDMDGDGRLNGPSDWDTDGDGMPDGYEFCFSNVLEHPGSGATAASQTLDPANNSDGYGDWDEDGMNNIEEYQVALSFGEDKFTSPWHEDTDEDGMPDGWEIWFARWDVIGDEWTLNPLQPIDRWLDADDDGMTNWEEYNLISADLSETNTNRSSPQWFVTTLGSAYAFQQWPSASITYSFGTYMSSDQYNLTGPTGDPNNVDTDGDGIIDGLELLFTAWNISAQTWTLNPVVAGDGTFDSDNDGLVDLQEFALATSNPQNGIDAPADAPLMHEDGDVQQPTKKAQRVFQILISKDSRGKRLLDDFNAWQAGEPPNVFISLLLGMTDPTNPDTDDDGMYDGFEYWFTSWDLNENRWGLNPLIETDVNLDSDGDSYDCNQDGTIDLDERFSNLREWESRTWGKYLNRSSVPAALGIIDFGEDAMNAYVEETGMNLIQARQALIDDFMAKGPDSVNRMNTINTFNENNFNQTLVGVSDPTHPDSDSDGIPDGWEYCYSDYMEVLPVNQFRWSLNPVNPLDVN